MVFKQDISRCLENFIGKNGLNPNQLEQEIKNIQKAIKPLASEKLKLFDFSDIDEKVKSIEKLVGELSVKHKNMYILGTGGATLCGQTITGLLEKHELNNKINFIDNIDPKTFEFLASQIKLEETLVLVVSKSGGTLETITQFAFFSKLYEDGLGEDKIKDHFLIITDADNENNIIRNIAGKLKIPVYPHEKVGGRFSIYSAASLIPACFAGINIREFLNGAAAEVKNTFSNENTACITGTALNFALAEYKHITSIVMMPYADRLKNFTTWFAQIWAESLGKTDRATTPIRSLGTLDQHSQLQLYLEGRKDKFFNVIYIKENEKDLKIELNRYFNDEKLNYINGKNFSKVINSAARATIETLAKKHSPVRVFEIDELDEYTLGSLTMHFILETVLLAKAWDINPFDQPAVEQGKKLTVEMLKNY